MSFRQAYPITAQYMTPGSKRRSGRTIDPSVKFIVAHDTGNPNSTARGNVRYYENSRNEISASAHLFLDDKEIIECVPALTGPPEKAWHVLYNRLEDNRLFGYNANDAAIGVEYCYGTNINADEAYARFIWLLSYLCYTFELDPRTSIVGHFFLDPQRKTDPVTGLAHSRRTYDQLLLDVVTEFNSSTDSLVAFPLPPQKQGGTVTATVRLNIRRGEPTTKAPIARIIDPGTSLSFTKAVQGTSINGNATWYVEEGGDCFWSGGVM